MLRADRALMLPPERADPKSVRSLLFLALAARASAQIVAQVNGVALTAADLEPDPREVAAYRDKWTPEQFAQWQAQARSGRLAGRIWQAVKTDFCRTRDCEPNEADLDAWVKASAVMEQDRRVRDAARMADLEKRIPALAAGSPERKKLEEELRNLRMADEALRAGRGDADRRIGVAWVGAWKFNREMYRAYGGKVIFQQGGPEPLDAMTKLLREHEKKGTFVIHDAKLHKGFWAYYTTMGHNNMPDGGKFLETPWWLQKKPAQP